MASQIRLVQQPSLDLSDAPRAIRREHLLEVPPRRRGTGDRSVR